MPLNNSHEIVFSSFKIKQYILPRTPNLYWDPAPNDLKDPPLGGFMDPEDFFESSVFFFLFSTVGTAIARRLKASLSARSAASILSGTEYWLEWINLCTIEVAAFTEAQKKVVIIKFHNRGICSLFM